MGSEAFPEPLEGFRKLLLGLPGVAGLRLLLPKRDVTKRTETKNEGKKDRNNETKTQD